MKREEVQGKIKFDREIKRMGKNVRVKIWEEFKGLAVEKKPKSIIYIIAQGIPAKNLTSLKLILPVEGTQYIFHRLHKRQQTEEDRNIHSQ